MIYSVLAGVISCYAILFVVGVLVNTVAIEGSLIAIATICFIGAYFARHSRFVLRLATIIGGIAAGLVLASWFLLPILQGTGKAWITIAAIFTALAVYVGSRGPIHRRLLRRNCETGVRPAPPLGKEWLRWLLAFVL